jgi:hypothetical protein
MRDVQASLDWMKNQSLHGGPKWQHKCQSSVRSALALPAWAPSARIAFEKTPKAELHKLKAHEIEAGMILYGLESTQYGHAWLAAGHGKAWSVDYRRKGYIDLCTATLPNWTHRDWAWATLWTPYGHIKPITHHAVH